METNPYEKIIEDAVDAKFQYATSKAPNYVYGDARFTAQMIAQELNKEKDDA